MWSPWALLAAVVCVAIVHIWMKQRKIWAQYQHLPGPKPLPFVGNIFEFFKNDFDSLSPAFLWTLFLKTAMELGSRYNGIFVIYVGLQPTVFVSDPDHLRDLYTKTAVLDRGDMSRCLVADYRSTAFFDNVVLVEFVENVIVPFKGKVKIMLLNDAGEEWKKSRNMAMMNFTKTPTEKWMKDLPEVAQQLMTDLRKKANGPMFKCHNLLKMALADGIFHNATGERLRPNELFVLVDSADQMIRPTSMQAVKFVLKYVCNFSHESIERFLGSGLRAARDIYHQLVLKKTKELKELARNGETAPDLYIYKVLKNYPDSPLHMKANNFLSLFIAGADTTAATIGFIVICLGLFPDVQEKVYQEDREVQSLLAGRQLEVDDLKNYSYLERVIKETLRIFTIVPLIPRKATEDIYFGKYQVPRGTEIFALPMFTNQNSQIFEDPFKFDPDRFLPENMEKLPPYAFNSFGAGRRVCLGTRFAYIAMKTILSSIVREFRITTEYTSLEEVLRNIGIWISLRDKNEIPIQLETRK